MFNMLNQHSGPSIMEKEPNTESLVITLAVVLRSVVFSPCIAVPLNTYPLNFNTC